MKRWFPWVLAAVAAGWAFSAWRLPGGGTERAAAVAEFGRLPLVFNGRVQPFDSLARNSLLQIRGKQSANYEPWKGPFDKPEQATAMDWLLEVMTTPELARTRKIFRIDHPELKGLFGLPMDPDPSRQDDGKHYAWSQLEPRLEEFKKVMREVPANATDHTPFQKAVTRLHNALTLFMRWQNILQPMDARAAVPEFAAFEAIAPGGVAAFQARMADRPFDTNALTVLLTQSQRFMAMEGMETPLVIPPAAATGTTREWQRLGTALMSLALPTELLNHLTGRAPLPEADVTRLLQGLGKATLSPAVGQYARMADAFRTGQFVELRKLALAYGESLRGPHPREFAKVRAEQKLNHWAPFYKAMILYVAAFLLVGLFWTTLSELPRRMSWWLVLIGLVVHSLGLVDRMLIEGRPPVTNLYSSAVFIGWGAVALGLVIERFWRNAIGLAIASTLGFVTLIVAHGLHGLSKDADTMQLMQAVLDTNFWLATHVVIVTLGYASTYVAGFLAILYVLLGLVTRVITADMAKALSRAVYGILCFATLFSFVGTVLGGIWADQSWGRFWGWDPKENGALIIVLWNALILHARWGGMVRERGIMLLALVGNIVTSWSWFGTNMLGIGLHSYGAMDSAFFWLLTFMGSQVLLMLAGLLPQRLWRSWQTRTKPSGAPPMRPTGTGRPATA